AIVQSSVLSTLSWAPVLFRLPHDVLFGSVNYGNVTLTGDAMHPMGIRVSVTTADSWLERDFPEPSDDTPISGGSEPPG
ncbi:hypothetical protein PanWU01x14_370170, partial [Parasponia andersonii]